MYDIKTLVESGGLKHLDLIVNAQKAYRRAVNAKYGEDCTQFLKEMDNHTAHFAVVNSIHLDNAEKIRDFTEIEMEVTQGIYSYSVNFKTPENTKDQ